MRHYVALAGQYRQRPAYAEGFEERRRAVEALADVAGLCTRLKHSLEVDGVVDDLPVSRGHQYVRIVECSCKDPYGHSDPNPLEDWQGEDYS